MINIDSTCNSSFEALVAYNTLPLKLSLLGSSPRCIFIFVNNRFLLQNYFFWLPISLVSFVCGVSWFFKFAAHSKRFCLCFYFSPLFSVVDSSRQCPAEVIVSTAAASSFLLLKNHMVVNLKYWFALNFFSIFLLDEFLLSFLYVLRLCFLSVFIFWMHCPPHL